MENLIKTVSNVQWKDVPRLKVNFYYLDFDVDKVREDDFVKYLANLLILFCLPKKEIDRAMSLPDSEKIQALTELTLKAQRLFIDVSKKKTTEKQAGEPGELILYSLLECFLKAPQILAKMNLKMNSNVPVHGSDGVHVGFDPINNSLLLYYGEAKLVSNFKTAVQSALKSCMEIVNNVEDKKTREIEIITTHFDVGDGEDKEKLRQEIIKYLGTYNRDASKYPCQEIFSCFIGFDYSLLKDIKCKNPEEIKKIFIEQYNNDVKGFADTILDKVKEENAHIHNFHFFLLPFESLQIFREKFYQAIGLK